MIRIKLKGNFKNSERFFRNADTTLKFKLESIFRKYGQLGVEALQQATPKDTGEAAASWTYDVSANGISWSNSKEISSGTPLVILLQYGHGTRGGGYVQGIDFINPALRPIFDELADNCWKEIQNL